MKPPKRVTRCVTRHAACDCREWHFARYREALQVIETVASSFRTKNEAAYIVVNDIAKKCREALEPINYD